MSCKQYRFRVSAGRSGMELPMHDSCKLSSGRSSTSRRMIGAHTTSKAVVSHMLQTSHSPHRGVLQNLSMPRHNGDVWESREVSVIVIASGCFLSLDDFLLKTRKRRLHFCADAVIGWQIFAKKRTLILQTSRLTLHLHSRINLRKI